MRWASHVASFYIYVCALRRNKTSHFSPLLAVSSHVELATLDCDELALAVDAASLEIPLGPTEVSFLRDAVY